MSHASRKIERVESLLEQAAVLVTAARDVIELSDLRCDNYFTWDEKDELDNLAPRIEAIVDAFRSRKPTPR